MYKVVVSPSMLGFSAKITSFISSSLILFKSESIFICSGFTPSNGEINIILRPEDSKDEDAILKKCEDLLYPFNINAHYEVVERTKPLTKVLDILSKQAGDENKGLLVIGDGTKVFKEILKHPEAFGSLHYSLFVCK